MELFDILLIVCVTKTVKLCGSDGGGNGCTARDCVVSSWTNWGACTQSCGNAGTLKRTRHHTAGPQCGGSCNFQMEETKACNRKCCPVDCAFSYTAWSTCAGCGKKGKSTRKISITIPPNCGGKACPTALTENRVCDTGRCCPVNCVLNNWGSFGPCNAACEKMGKKTRTRTIKTNPSCNGVVCGSLTGQMHCAGPCCPKDCVLSTWAPWGNCIAPTGACSANSGTQTRSRRVLKVAYCNGGCGATSASQRCKPASIPCRLNSWGSWSSCAATNGKCGSGTRTRSRTVRTHPKCSAKCGSLTESGPCIHSCCPKNCEYNLWGQWGRCTNQCGNGVQQRTRKIKSYHSCNGVTCKNNQLKNTRTCTVYSNVDCRVSAWSSWSACSNGCGSGTSTRTRRITVAKRCNGQACSSLSQTRACQSYRDNRDCVVSQWSTYGSCTEKCAVGVRYRNRNVTRPTVCNGRMCPTLTSTIVCGQSNGGCDHNCNNGMCSCRLGYHLIGRATCQAKDCGTPSLNYCPPGEKQRGACIYPTINCASSQTAYPTQCPLTCPTGYTLVGESKLPCQTTGRWKNIQSFCKRDNEPPTDLILSGDSSVPENALTPFDIGQLTTIDFNINDTHTYTIKRDDCNCFSIVGNTLKALKPFDFEAQVNTFQIDVETKDNGIPHLSFRKTVTIAVTDVNEKPTDIILSNGFVDENTDASFVVGTLQTVDADRNQTYKYNVIGGNLLFRIQGNQIITASTNKDCLTSKKPNTCPINYEKDRSITLLVNAMDSGNPPLDLNKQLTVNIRDVNDVPYGVKLSASDVNENAGANTYIGTFTTEEEDNGQILSYKLIDDDNGGFHIDALSGRLYKSKPSDYESTYAHSIVVEVTDNGTPKKSVQQNFTVNVIDINEPPVNVTLKNTMFPMNNRTFFVPENTTTNTIIAAVFVYDRDSINTVQISLDDTYNNAFTIQTNVRCSSILGNRGAKSVCNANVYLSKELNYELKSNYDLKFRVVERGHSALHHFFLNVTDSNDAPSNVKIQNGKQIDVMENQEGIDVGTLSTEDEDPNQIHTYTLLNENSTFEINGNLLKLKSNVQMNYEVRTSYSLDIQSTDNGIPAKSIQQQIDVNVIDVNDPASLITLSSFQLSENEKDVVVANVTITDEDDPSPSPATHQCITRKPSPFYVSGLQIYVSSPLDYESQNTVRVVLVCTDRSIVTYSNFQMHVIDVNEPPAAIRFTAINISESSIPPFYIGNFSCIDPEDDDCTFQLQNIRWKDFLEIRGKSLYAISPIDYESETVLNIDIEATDTGSPPLNYNKKLVLSVIDENEAPSDITLSNDVIDENSPEYTVVGYLATIDEDRGQTHSYQLTDDAQGRFEINNNTLRVSKVSSQCVQYSGKFCRLNFEKSPGQQLSVMVTDNGVPPLTLTKNFIVYLRNVNDAPRDITLSNYKVYENATVDSLIGIFNASDEDFGQILTFKLVAGDTGHFYIDGQSYLRLKTNFSDYETQKTYKILVSVEDNGARKLQTSNYVTIEVLNVNEPPIDIVITDDNASQRFNYSNPHVAENTKLETVVGTVSSNDADYASSLVFKLDDDSNGTFILSNKTLCTNVTLSNVKTICKTELLVANHINYEIKSFHKILIRVTDQGGLFHIQEMTVVVIDEDDRSTELVIDNYHFVSVTEGSRDVAYQIGRLRTIDEDTWQTFKYELVDANMTKIFDVQNGNLMVKANTVLDFESVSMYTLSFNVFDDGALHTIVLRDSIDVQILDINEPPQAIQLDNLSVLENSHPGVVVTNISVVDPDNFGVGKIKQTHNCTVLKGSYFKVTGADKRLTVGQENIDFEQKPVIDVEIQCSDSGSPSLTLTETFTINVQDVNEKPINISISSKYVMENAAPGTIGDFSTDDHDNFDGLIQQTFVYELLNKSAPFTIKNSTLCTTSTLDYEMQNIYNLYIRSTDDGEPSLSTESLIQVNVVDVNEPASGIMLSSSRVIENPVKATKIGDLSAIDEDRSSTGQKQQHTFELLQNPKGIFRIAGERLEVALDCNTELCKHYGGAHCLLNFENNAYQSIRIKATDDGSPPQSFEQTFGIQILNINEPPRSIQLSKRTVLENATIGTVIGKVTFMDEDYGDNHTVYLPNDDQGRFEINGNNEVVKAKATNYEKQSVHHITIGVKDNGSPPLNATFDVSVYVEDINESPTSLHITDQHGANTFTTDRAQIDENLPAGSIVGTIKAFDQDTVTDLVFSLVDNAGGRFRLDKNVTCQNITLNNTLHTACETKLLTNSILNYEENNVLVVLVKVADHANLTHVTQFNISLVDKNDAPTNVTVSGETIVFVLENRRDVEIGKFETVDEDSDQTHTYQLIDDAGQRFSVKPASVGGYALYTTSIDINYEESNNYDVIVMTTDNGNPPMMFRHSIKIQVLDQNESPTDIMLSSNNVYENSPDMTFIGNIAVIDPDNELYAGQQTHSCNIKQYHGTEQSPFTLKGNRMYTQTCPMCKELDYEANNVLSVYIQCDDSGYPSQRLVKLLTVNIVDVNERPTGLSLSNNKVPENIQNIYVGSFTGIDPDKNRNQSLRFVLLDDGGGRFYLHDEKLLTSTKLDYEKNQSHTIRVKVSDYEGLYYTTTFTLLVDDQNDAPTDLTCTSAFSLPETSLPGTTVGTCTAEDEDTSQTHHYEILRILGVGYNQTELFPNPTKIFKIESSTGRIEQVEKSLNHEKHVEYILTIQTTDSGTPPLSIKKNVTISITNVNQPPTDIKLLNNKITENSPVGTVVGQLLIIDPDNKHKYVHGFTCSISNVDESKCAFTVDKDNRVVVGVLDLVDFEYVPFYDVNISCIEDTINKYHISRTVTINIMNVNEAPRNVLLKPNEINEHNQPGDIVGTISFFEPDNLNSNIDQVTVSNFKTFGAPFNLSGPYTIVASQRLDHETAAEYTVEVTLTDNGTPTGSTTRNLTIKVNDLNDYPENITLSTLSLSENLNPGDKVATIETIDQDKGTTHTYQLLDDGGVFKISKNELILTKSVQFKFTKTVSVFIQSTDDGTPPLRIQEVFVLNVVDENNAPSDVQYTILPMNENTKGKVKVAELHVVDDDIVQTHTCVGVNVDFVECFTEKNGNVSVYILGDKKNTDYEKSQSFDITLRCSDNGAQNLSINKSLTIPVSDVNENPTDVTINRNKEAAIPENTQPGYIIGKLDCVDPDKDNACTFTLFGNSTDLFKVVGDELQVKNLSLNFEAPPGVTSSFVYIQTTDQGGLSYKAAIKITSTDVNEAPYDIRFAEGDVMVPENKSVNINFAELLANDPDTTNQKLTFTLKNFENDFEIVKVKSRSFLQLKQELDFDLNSRYEVSILASDDGSPSRSTSGNVIISVLRSDRCITHSMICQQHASCARMSKTKVTCTCDEGFKEGTNKKCVKINECEESCDNCLNIDQQTECKAGRAPLCGKCFHNGTCHDQHLNFTCSCVPGYTGNQCYTNIDDCASKPCVYGACIDGINLYKCKCYKGYEGEHCAEQIDECKLKKQPCYKSECEDLLDSYKCTCPGEYTGVFCERKPCSASQCGKEHFCHSVNLMDGGNDDARCIPNDRLVSLLFDKNFAPLSGGKMFEWKFKFIRFLSNEVKIPYSWLTKEISGVSKDVSLDDVAIYEYADGSISRSKRSNQAEITTNITKVSFYSIWGETAVKPNILLYAINDTCDQYYTCGQTHTDFDIKNNVFECRICKAVNSFIQTNVNNENFFRPVVLSSIGEQEDPLWMDVLPIAGIVLCGLIFIVIGVVIYRRRRNNYKFIRDRLETDRQINRGTSLSVLEERSRTWTENDLVNYSGSVNPMFGLDEEELDSPVVGEISYRKTNPDWNSVFSAEQTNVAAASAGSGMFDNPLYGLSVDDDDDEDKTTKEDLEHRGHSKGFFNPVFQTDNPESEF